ncbi:MAG: hypothetical protein H0U64_11150 [Gemmatimonadaceae bacterium]|nr:hypothetical protein [Gemmatimonadaceae bacterium]
MRKLVRSTFIIGLSGFLAACASGGGAGGVGTGPGTVDPSAGQTLSTAGNPWSIATREHVDLWLHGFAMITDDTTLVPYFRRGYKAELAGVRTRANAVTQLDANRDRLAARFAISRDLVNAQFVPMQFSSLDQMLEAIDIFLQAQGNPRAANSREVAEVIALLAGYFPVPADREWLRLFAQSLRDENNKFYRSYWDQQQSERATVLAAVNDRWQNSYRAKFQRYLNNTGQPAGTILLSLPLDGEGRSLGGGKLQNTVGVSFPSTVATADEAIYVIAHEVALGPLAQAAVRENITPAEQRAGVGTRYETFAAVRAGVMLLQRIAPELVDGYARYYLRSAGRSVGSNPLASLTAAFPLNDLIRDAISRQLDVVLGGV